MLTRNAPTDVAHPAGMTQEAGTPTIDRLGVTLWIAGAVIGAVFGFATLAVAPIAIVPELVALPVLAWARPRPSGLAGALVGHGLAWLGLLSTSSRICRLDVPSQCTYSLPLGPAHSSDGSAWQADVARWIVGALLIALVGLVLTAVARRRLRTHGNLAPAHRPSGLALRRLAYDPAGPVVLAVALALISLPFVALNLQVYEFAGTGFGIEDIAPLSPTDPARWTAAFSAVLLSSVVAGIIGGWLIRHRRGYSYWAALPVAWICGIGGTTLLPALLGQRFGAVPMCIDGCGYTLTTNDPGANFLAAALCFWLGPLYEGQALGALIVGFVAWSQILIRYGPAAPPPEVPQWGLARQTSNPLPAPYPWPRPVAPAASAAPAPRPIPAPATPSNQPDNGDHKAG